MHPVRALLASVSAATALLTAPDLASAAIPTGTFELHFGGRQSIWIGEADTEGEEFCTEFGAGFDALEFCDFHAFVDGKGRIYGYLKFAGWSGGLYFAEEGPISGTQRGNDQSGIARVKLSIKLTGIASDGSMTAHYPIADPPLPTHDVRGPRERRLGRARLCQGAEVSRG